MARGGMRIGEVLKLKLKDIQDRKLILREPKSGKEQEVVFIPQKVADRLRDYAIRICKSPDDRIFPITYEAARVIVLKAGKMVSIHLRPHDLRRHSATYASRSGLPIESVLRLHQACFFIVLDGAIMQWCRKAVFDHLLFFQVPKCWMQSPELVKILKNRLNDDVDYLFGNQA